MADEEKNDKEVSQTDLNSAKEEKVQNFENLIQRLKSQGDGVQTDMTPEYREMRRYVRENPEESVLLTFLGGIALGYLLGKLRD